MSAIEQVVNGLAERAFRNHYRDVLRFVRRRTASEHEAEEVTQAVFAQAAEQLDARKQGSAPVLAWLFTVAARRLVDETRRRSRAGVAAPLDGLVLAAAEHRYGDDVSRTLRLALERLPESQRSVVVGRLIEGRSFAELAGALNATEAACKMRFVRGLESVRALFEKEGLEP